MLVVRGMSDDQRGDDGQRRQCRRRGGISADVELGAALALADMASGSAGVGLALGPGPAKRDDTPAPAAAVQLQQPPPLQRDEHMTDDEEIASTRLSLELGKVGIHSSSPCSSSSSAGRPALQAGPPAPAPAAATGPSRPRHMLTEAEKEAKRLRRVLANRESARQTILRRQEKDRVMKEYLSLKETNRQLRAQTHHLSLSLI